MTSKARPSGGRTASGGPVGDKAGVATEDPTYGLTKRLYETLLRDVLQDSLMTWKVQAKRKNLEGSRQSGACSICGQKCAPHSGTLNGVSNGQSTASQAGPSAGTSAQGDQSGGSGTGSSSRLGTPAPSGGGASNGNLPANPLKPDIYAANPLFECIVCSRQVSSNRYAVHLAKCLGIGGKEKSSRKAGSGNGNGGGAAGSSAASDAGGNTGNSLLNTPRVISVLEQRRKARAPDALLRVARGEEKAKGKIKGLNLNGKRALSPGSAMGAHWKKMKTHTPPPVGSAPREDGIPMARSQSVQAVSHTSTAPTYASPLNPNKRANAGDAAPASERDASPAMSVSTAAGGDASMSVSAGAGAGTGTGKSKLGDTGKAKSAAGPGRSQSILSEESPLKGKAAKAGGESDSDSYHESDSDAMSPGGQDDDSEMSEESDLED